MTFWGHTLLKYPSLNRVETRIQSELGLPLRFGAPAQLLFYPEGSQYRPHLDCGGNLSGTVEEANERIFSILIYLNDVESGGETVFPNIPMISPARAGDALIWRSLDLRNRSCTNATLHSAGIVRVGEKYAYQRWFHLHPKRYDDFVEKFASLRRFANMKADSTVVCESVVGSCRNYITVIPRDAAFFQDLETEMKMLDRRAESNMKWSEIRRVVRELRFRERQLVDELSLCDASIILVHDLYRLLRKSAPIVRAMRRHDTEIIFSGSTGLGVEALLTAFLGKYTTFHVSSCERAKMVREVWSDVLSSFVKERVRVTCEDQVSRGENSRVLVQLEPCELIEQYQSHILKQGDVLVSYQNSSSIWSSSSSGVASSYVSDSYRLQLYSHGENDDFHENSCSDFKYYDHSGRRKIFIHY